MNHLKSTLLVIILHTTVTVFSQAPTIEKEPALRVNATYKGDVVSNTEGGIRTGTAYLGLVDLFLNLDTEHAGFWKGGELMIHGTNSHGEEPSANLIGDLQVVSNIEAGNHTFLYELWYKQEIATICITIGLQDMNAEFAGCDAGSLFINSSFGIHSVIAGNIVAPIFPLTSTGLTICWEPPGLFHLKTAVYKGCPVDFESNPHNLKWDLNFQNGLLWIAEGEFSWSGQKNRENTFKAGTFFQRHRKNEGDTQTEEKNEYDYGFYLTGNHQLSREHDKNKLNAFYQLGWSPRNDNFGYLGAGFTYSGLFSRKNKDIAGLAMARAMMTGTSSRDETTVELTYKTQVTKNIYFQPDVQYVIQPAGTEKQLKNAVAGLLRFGMEF